MRKSRWIVVGQSISPPMAVALVSGYGHPVTIPRSACKVSFSVCSSGKAGRPRNAWIDTSRSPNSLVANSVRNFLSPDL
jgi:hypothetical protein